MSEPLFRSFFMGGFECSSHRLHTGKRLDLLNSTQHDAFMVQDFRRLQAEGIHTVRSGIRWHLIEPTPNRYDFSSVIPALRAARDTDMQVIWDLCHYGYPDDIDIFSPEFVRRFTRMVTAFAKVYAQETDETPFFCPINEISFFSWGGGDAGYLNPFARGRGFELKVQLVRAAIEAIEAVWSVLPEARIVHVDPVINIVADPSRPYDYPWAEGHRQAQYQAWDMLSGRIWQGVGGHPKYLDIIGLNYYSNNQWIHDGPTLDRRDPLYRPFRQIAQEVYERYERPIFIAETGIEDEARPDWFRYMADEVIVLVDAGIPIEGVCLYPIVCHPGWDNDRHCHNGMWDYINADGERDVYEPLAREVRRQQVRVQAAQHNPAYLRRRVPSVSSKPKVCLFTDSLEPSGMGEHMLALADTLKADYAITFTCPPTEAGSAFLGRAKKIGVNTMPMQVRGESRVSWEHLRDWLRERAIDIFHGHAGIGWEGHDGIYAAHHARTPVIVRTEHLPYLMTDPVQRQHYQALSKKITRIVCVSDEVCASYAAHGIAAHQLHTIRNGIAPRLSTANRAHMLRKLRLPHDARVILTVARMTAQKGYDTLLESIPDVIEAHPNAYFVWVGSGVLEAGLQTSVKTVGLEKRVRFLGNRRDVPDLYAAADVFVLPSLFEGLPLTLLEAMAAGVPVVATRIGGVTEVIRDRVHGLLADSQDAAALADAIIETLDAENFSRIDAQRHAAKTLFESSFSADRMARETDALYQATLHAARTPLVLTVSQTPHYHNGAGSLNGKSPLIVSSAG